MKLGKKIIVLFLLAAITVINLPAETNEPPSIIGSPNIPQWIKDVRRWEIVAFGSIPFTMLTATFAMDMYRWNNANGMDFSEEGRRYAPWPFKSAGAVLMDGKDQELVFLMAAGLSLTIAFADQIIFQIKRYQERKRVAALPSGTTIITRRPWPEGSEAEAGAEETEAAPVTPEPESPAREE